MLNKKQLAVLWFMVIAISGIMLFVPKITYYNSSYVKLGELLTSSAEKLAHLTNWSLIFSFCVPIAIIGGALICTFKTKK